MTLEPYWPVVLVALAVWIIPGALFSWAAGVPAHRSLVSGLPVTAGLWGLIAAVYGAVGIPFTQLSVWAGTAILVVAACGIRLVRWRWRRRARAGAKNNGAQSLGAKNTGARNPEADNADPEADNAVAAAENASDQAVEPQPAEPQAAEPQPTEPQPTEPQAVEPQPTEPQAVEPQPTAPEGEATAVEGASGEKDDTHQPTWQTRTLDILRALLPVTGVIAGTWLMISRGLDAMEDTPHGLDSIPQGWDSHWHASTIRFIMEQHTASSTHMGDLQNIESHTTLFYPSAWHAMVFMLREVADLTVIQAVNLGAKVLPAVAIALSVSLLAWILVRGGTRRAGLGTVIAACLAPIIAAGILPLYYVSFYVGMFPYAAAMGMCGIVIWMLCRIPSHPALILPAAIGLAGLGMLHPAPITHVGIFVALWWLGEGVLRRQSPASWGVNNRYLAPVVTRVRATVYLALAVLGAVAVVLPQFVIGSAQSEEVSSFVPPDNGISRAESWAKILYLQTRHAWEYGIDWWVVWTAAVGLVVILIWRRNLWALAVFVAFALIAVDSVRSFAGPVGAAAKAIGALHYNSAHRLVMPVAMLEAVFSAAALAFVIHVVFQIIPMSIKRNGQHIRPLVVGGVGAGVVVALLLAVQLPKATQEPKQEGFDYLMASAYDPRMVTDADLKAFDWLATQPKAYDGLILNNPDEGAGWMYAYNGLPALHRHYLWPRVTDDSATTELYWRPDGLGRGGRADQAARQLNVNYIVASPPHYWAWQKDILGQGPRLFNAPGVTPIYQDGPLYIYAVNAQFSAEQLEDMVRQSPMPVVGPPPQAPDAVDQVVEEPPMTD